MTPTFDIYTDGSCLANPGPGGWAAIIEHDGETDRLSGGERSTTNNRMEVTAAIKGLEAVPVGATAVVHSDSEYLVKTMTKGWKRNANRDLWEQLDRIATRRNVDFRWVRGHAGHPQNEEADRLAVRAMQSAAGRTLPLETVAEGAPPPAAPSPGLTHIDAQGAARMVDVGSKPDSDRFAAAAGTVTMRPETLALILQGKMEKGDVFTVARIAGVNAAKHTWELIPLAHQIPLSHVEVDFETDPPQGRVTVSSRARTIAKTGVEMEALTAVAVAGLTIYDMCKAVDRSMTIGDVRLQEKTGGVHGDYKAP